ncbi:MAG: fumarate hydratase [Archaeoglobus sp.]|nr:MAG: fumarate hydratase [Archaeoglobus sp.]
MVSRREFVDTLIELLRKAETELGEDVLELIRDAEKREEGTAKLILQSILKNVELAKENSIPMCQDTGIPIIFLDVGRDAELKFDIYEASREAVSRATKLIPLRPNAVHPLTRENSGDNTGLNVPIVHCRIVEGDEVTIAVMPKGAGSENVSKQMMLLPGDSERVVDFIVDVVREAGGKPCPPVFVGVGIGGTFDESTILAKRALLRDVRKMNRFEKEILNRINMLGIGPMGLGGKTTALSVLVEIAHCHTASLPLAVNVQCWANRRAFAVL